MSEAPASIAVIESDIVEEFDLFDDPMDRYDYIIDLGGKLGAYPEEHRKDENLVRGCQSKVWLHAHREADRIYFQADSNTVITKGIIALLVRVMSGQKTEDVVSADLSFVDKIDLRSHLSSQRSNGLTAMIQRMKLEAAKPANSTIPSAAGGAALPVAPELVEGPLRDQVIAALKTVFDPEIPVDIYELGLIYNIGSRRPGFIEIRMTLTSPLCPVAGSLPFEVKEKVEAVEGVEEAEIEMTFDPPWSKDRLSEEAQLELGWL